MPEKILALLRNNNYVSGEAISRRLGITRAAVWKKISLLRQKGFSIEAVPSKGYCLISGPDLSPEIVLAGTGRRFWKEIKVYDSVESTNSLALRLASEGSLLPGTVLIADRQTSGRGRLGRRWVSPAGVNIYMSLVIRPELEPKDLTMLTILAGVASAAGLKEACGIPVTLKWPNDLVAEDRKLGGILTEIRADPDSISLAVIGIGINVNIFRKDMAEEIRDIATSAAILSRKTCPRNEIIVRILGEFERWHALLKKDGKKRLLDAWRDLSSTIGRNVRASVGSSMISGIAEDIDDNGMLLVRTSFGRLVTVSAGDVIHLR